MAQLDPRPLFQTVRRGSRGLGTRIGKVHDTEEEALRWLEQNGYIKQGDEFVKGDEVVFVDSFYVPPM